LLKETHTKTVDSHSNLENIITYDKTL